MANILYIEDEYDIGSWVQQDLMSRGYTVEWHQNGDNVLAEVSTFDLVILDIMLPGLDGFSIGKRVKKDYPKIPILMLSARSAVEDKVEALQFADDYVTKPFHPEELGARVDVLLRRFERNTPDVIELEHVLFYPHANQLINQERNEEILLTSKQWKIFKFFIQHAGQILTKEQIYEAVWNEPALEGDKTLMVHIRYLREKIEKDPAKPLILETIRGIGYRLRR